DTIAIGMRLRVADRILWFTREVHQLKQLIPICAYCHKIHTAKDYWQRFETYIKQQTGSEFSHGICLECLEAETAKLRCASGFRFALRRGGNCVCHYRLFSRRDHSYG